MKNIIENSADYSENYSEKNNVFEIYNYQNSYTNNFQSSINNYEKLSEKNSSIACYVCNTNFLLNNKLHQYFMNYVKTI